MIQPSLRNQRNDADFASAAASTAFVSDTLLNPPLAAAQQQITDNLDELLKVLPASICTALEVYAPLEGIFEIVMDLGRIPEARFADRVIELRTEPVSAEEIEHVVQRVGTFGKDNRAGIERTLHRISAIRNRKNHIIGLTCRIGRAVYGTIDIIQDVVENGRSILLLGRPGRGKTTKLREIARILSEQMLKRVIIVDTSNEIAGDGDIPHPAIGKARRMQVANPEDQHNVMIEAVENHMPEVIVIDEIGTEQEAFAARTIAERGVQLIGTAHGNTLDNLMMNPTLSDLVGGIHAVTLSDDEARRRGTQKTVLERKAPPTFDVVIEIIEVDKLALHLNVERTVDRLLRGMQGNPEIRIRNQEGTIEVVSVGDNAAPVIREMVEEANREGRGDRRPSTSAPPVRAAKVAEAPKTPATIPLKNSHAKPKLVRIFPYGVSRSRLDRAVMEMHVTANVAKDIAEADVVLALKSTYRREPAKIREASQRHIPTYVVRSNTYAQIAEGVREIFGLAPTDSDDDDEPLEETLLETQDTIDRVKQTHSALELAPANSYVRRLQHQLVERSQLFSESVGVEPYRRVRILPVSA